MFHNEQESRKFLGLSETIKNIRNTTLLRIRQKEVGADGDLLVKWLSFSHLTRRSLVPSPSAPTSFCLILRTSSSWCRISRKEKDYAVFWHTARVMKNLFD